MSSPKSHFWMITSQLTFTTPSGSQDSRTMNMIVETPMKAVPSTALNQATRGMMARLKAEQDIQPQTIRDYVVLSVSWLGLMARDEFYDMADPTAPQRH